jgi:hypothetical protein
MKEKIRVRGTREYDFLSLTEDGAIRIWVEGEETTIRPEEVAKLKEALNDDEEYIDGVTLARKAEILREPEVNGCCTIHRSVNTNIGWWNNMIGYLSEMGYEIRKKANPTRLHKRFKTS